MASSSAQPRAPTLSPSDLKSANTNDGYKTAKRIANIYNTTYGLADFDSCSEEVLCSFDYIDSFAKWMVEDCKMQSDDTKSYALGSVKQTISGIKMMIERRFGSQNPKPFYLSQEHKGDYERHHMEVIGYVVRTMTLAAWERSENVYEYVSTLGREQCKAISLWLLKDCDRKTSSHLSHRDRLLIAMTYAGMGRTSEVFSSSYDGWSVIDDLGIVQAIWKESKLSAEKPMTWVPDVESFSLDVTHCFATLWMLEPEILSWRGRPINSSYVETNKVFPHLHSLKNPAKHLGEIIKRILKDESFALLIGLTKGHNGSSIRPGTSQFISRYGDTLNYLHMLSRSGHSTGMEKKTTFLVYATVPSLDAVMNTIPAGSILAGWPKKCFPIAPSLNHIVLTEVERERLNGVVTELFNFDNLPFLAKGQNGWPFVMVCFASLLRFHHDVERTCPGHRVVALTYRAFLDNGFTLQRFNEICAHVRREFDLKNAPSQDRETALENCCAAVSTLNGEIKEMKADMQVISHRLTEIIGSLSVIQGAVLRLHASPATTPSGSRKRPASPADNDGSSSSTQQTRRRLIPSSTPQSSVSSSSLSSQSLSAASSGQLSQPPVSSSDQSSSSSSSLPSTSSSTATSSGFFQNRRSAVDALTSVATNVAPSNLSNVAIKDILFDFKVTCNMNFERIVSMNPALYAPNGKKKSDVIGRTKRVLETMIGMALTDNQGRLLDSSKPLATSSEYEEWKQSFQTLCNELQDAVLSQLTNRYDKIVTYLEERMPNLNKRDKKAFYTTIFQTTKFQRNGDPFVSGVANRLSAIGTLETKLEKWVEDNPAERTV